MRDAYAAVLLVHARSTDRYQGQMMVKSPPSSKHSVTAVVSRWLALSICEAHAGLAMIHACSTICHALKNMASPSVIPWKDLRGSSMVHAPSPPTWWRSCDLSGRPIRIHFYVLCAWLLACWIVAEKSCPVGLAYGVDGADVDVASQQGCGRLCP
jgi:hypothetical protein